MNINITFWVPLIVAISALWVYIDASANKIGKTSQSGFFNIGASWWGFACLFLWIIAFPSYLIIRKKLIALATAYPVEPKAREIKIAIFVLVCFLRMLT